MLNEYKKICVKKEKIEHEIKKTIREYIPNEEHVADIYEFMINPRTAVDLVTLTCHIMFVTELDHFEAALVADRVLCKLNKNI